MLEIIRGRRWSVAHTIMDGATGPVTDLSVFTSIRAQIREKIAVRNLQGIFEHKLIATCTVVAATPLVTISLTAAQTEALSPKDYLIDMWGVTASTDESLLDPEPVRVTNRPTRA
jgi:hypothetical protein